MISIPSRNSYATSRFSIGSFWRVEYFGEYITFSDLRIRWGWNPLRNGVRSKNPRQPCAEDNSQVIDQPGLLFVPSEALGEHLYLAPSVLRFHEDCERSVSTFPLQDCRGRRNQVAAVLGPGLGLEIRRQFGTDAL